jgi:hypothetical protein
LNTTILHNRQQLHKVKQRQLIVFIYIFFSSLRGVQIAAKGPIREGKTYQKVVEFGLLLCGFSGASNLAVRPEKADQIRIGITT